MRGVRIWPAVAADEPAVPACAEGAYARYVAAIGREPAPMVADFAAQIGAGLVRMAMDGAGRLASFAVVGLHTNAKMTENLSLYPRLGYVEVERRTEDSFGRVFFEKRLG